ncbi:MAG: TMEM175 family protein, partial [Actinomycetota bacterium]
SDLNTFRLTAGAIAILAAATSTVFAQRASLTTAAKAKPFVAPQSQATVTHPTATSTSAGAPARNAIGLPAAGTAANTIGAPHGPGQGGPNINAAKPPMPGAPGLHSVVPQLLVYVLSFTMVGIYWNNHHLLLRATRRMDSGVMWSNLFLLLWLSLLPAVTAWMGEFPGHALPAACYGMIALGAGFSYSLLTKRIIRANGSDSDVARAIGRDRKGFISLGLYFGGVLFAFVSPIISYVAYATVAVMWFIPDRRLNMVEQEDEGKPS